MINLTRLFPLVQTLEIKFPDGSPTGLKLKVVGQDSKQFREVAKQYGQQMLGSDSKPDIDLLEKQNTELIASCIVGWDEVIGDDGNPVMYSPENAKALVGTPELTYIRNQVEAYIGQRANFFRAVNEAA